MAEKFWHLISCLLEINLEPVSKLNFAEALLASISLKTGSRDYPIK